MVADRVTVAVRFPQAVQAKITLHGSKRQGCIKAALRSQQLQQILLLIKLYGVDILIQVFTQEGQRSAKMINEAGDGAFIE